MSRLFTVALLASALSLPAYAALKPGASAPDFSAKGSLAGKDFNFALKDALKKGPVVVYFYPAAFTKGCNIEAHTFAENKDKFDAAGATIIGVSQDSLDRLHAFSADPQYCAGKFPVASDADGKITSAYNLTARKIETPIKDSRGQDVAGTFTERVTYVVTSDSKIVATLSSNDDKVTPEEHVLKSLEVVQGLKK